MAIKTSITTVLQFNPISPISYVIKTMPNPIQPKTTVIYHERSNNK